MKRGNIIWVNNDKSEVKFIEDPNGKFNVAIFKYKWWERILIWFKLMRDRRYDGKYHVGIDPFDL